MTKRSTIKATPQRVRGTLARVALLGGGLICHLALGVLIASAQEGIPGNSSSQLVRVFVVDFSQRDMIPEMGDLGTIASGLVRLRLLELPALEVHRVVSMPACGTQTSGNPAQQLLNPSPTRMLRSDTAPGDFYVVQGAVGVRAPNIVADYSLQLCKDGVLQTLIHEAQPFTADHALEQLSVVANFITFRLAELAPTVKVSIGPFQAEDEKEISEGLKSKLMETITDMAGLEVTDSGEYVIRGHIVAQKSSPIPLLPLPKWSKSNNVKVEELNILAHGKSYPLESVSGTRDRLPELYSKVNAEVRRILPQVLLAERLGWSVLLDNMTAEDLLAKGKKFLCEGEPRECKQDLQSAIPVLTKATAMQPKEYGTFLLLGKAQYLSGHYGEAVKPLEEARRLEQAEKTEGRSVSKEDETRLLNLLGDSYTGIEKYDRAIESYDRSLAVDRSQAKVYERKSLAAAYRGDRPAALKTLLEGLNRTGNSESGASGLSQSVKTLIQRLESQELPSAEEMLKVAYETKASPVSNEYALLLTREGSEAVDSAKSPEDMNRARGYLQRALQVQPLEDAVRASVFGNLTRSYLGNDLDEASSYLSEAEKIPSEHLNTNARGWLLQLRAWYWIDRKDYERAYGAAQIARDTDHSKWSDFVFARAAWNLAATKEEKAKAAGEGKDQLQKEAQKLFQLASNLMDPLVNDRISGADYDYMEATHGLKRDSEALGRFQKIAELNPRDTSALRSIMYICTEYLFQIDCAYRAAVQDIQWEAPDPDAYLNAIEIAVLQGSDAQAEKWLDAFFAQPQATAYLKSIAHLYRTWLAVRRDQKDAELSSFRNWQTTIQEFRKTSEQMTWSFKGAKHTLEGLQINAGMKNLLASMIASFEDRNKPLPTFPSL